jgi:hypothetical protein
MYRVYWGNLRGRVYWGDPGVDVRITLRWILRKWAVEIWTIDCAGSGLGQLAGTCECGNKPSGSIKCGKFLDYLQAGGFSRRTPLHVVSK